VLVSPKAVSTLVWLPVSGEGEPIFRLGKPKPLQKGIEKCVSGIVATDEVLFQVLNPLLAGISTVWVLLPTFSQLIFP
jgi:hypothetical protein